MIRHISKYKLSQFSKRSLLFYSEQIRLGNQDQDVKIKYLRLLFYLDVWIAVKKDILDCINKLDFIDIIIFSIWFNNSLRNKIESIPKISIDLNASQNRDQINKVAFKSGIYWDLKNNMRQTSLNLEEEFNVLGQEIINCFEIS